MILLIDLDGTLVDTAHVRFKPMKDGEVNTDPSLIPVFNGAEDFIRNLTSLGHTPVIVSDSVSKYVNPIVKKYFNIPSISLSYKPNTKITEDFLKEQGFDLGNRDQFLVLGDTWLDIELGRAFGFRTILTQFYSASSVSEKDGIGKTWNHLKSGPTHVVKSFKEILEILDNPINSLWAAESFIHGGVSKRSMRLHELNQNGVHTIFRSLGRQQEGECDRYGIASYYKEFNREDRNPDNIEKLAKVVKTYISSIQEAAPKMQWDYFTYVSDKASTIPPNKMKFLFEKIELNIPKQQLIQWKDVVDGSIRDRPNYKKRREFIANNLFVSSNISLEKKSIIIIDDQFTTGGTAYEVVNKLRRNGASNILFITLFFMTSLVYSNKICPKCGKAMQIKIRKSDGNRFYSCTPPQYKGNGCGHAEKYD